MDILSTSTLFFIFFNFFLLSSPLSAYALHDRDGFINSREALEIIIGGGGAPDPSPPDDQDCPPPPPPPCPPPISEPSPIKSHPPPPPPPPPSPPPPPPPSPPPPPPPSPSPPPPPPPLPVKKRPKPEPLVFENELIANAFRVIQRLKPKIKGGRLDVLKTWKGSNVCKYKGFFCDIRPDLKKRAVSGVNFNGFKFSGDKKSSKLFLKGFIDDLKDIAFFHANSNFFVGEIPVNNLIQQPFFYELDLSNNKLPGQFPTQVLGAKLLTFLDIRFNGYCGPIPAQLFDQDIITAIFINNNNFTSDLPDNLGKTPAKYLTFASNQFTGRIPRSIGQAKKTMEEIVFRNNKFEGCLPYEIGFLENATLFDAGNNLLTGPIPLSFACLAKMELIYLADNQFYGPVPEIVCKLPKLGNFTLRNNFFTEVGPECKKLINKKILDVSNNCIPYFPNQKSREECEWFFKKPKQCGNDMSFKYIHCKNNWYLHPYVSNPTSENVTVVVKPKKSYAALSPDGRL